MSSFIIQHHIVQKEQREKKLLEILVANPAVTQAKLAKELKVAPRTVRRLLAKLQANGVVAREGSNRSGRWTIMPH